MGKLKFEVECENPNPSLYTFSGSVLTNHHDSRVSVGVSNVLLRGCILRQTKRVYGVVIFTGHDTKLYKNASAAPFKVR
jgi:phospholipid-transporting ATPase